MMSDDRKDVIYLDYNSTTPLEESVTEVIHRTCIECWANPSSSSELGKKAKECIEQARSKVGHCLNTEPNNVIFTSGGTEGNNMVIESCVKYGRSNGQGKPHIITSSVEHDATLEYVKHLKENDQIELSLIAMRNDGTICCQSLLDAVKHNTCLITLMMANNETGVIYPLAQIARGLKLINLKRKSMKLKKILLHTDAAQTIGKIPVDMKELNVDYITVVGHKFYGPRIGAVCRRDSDTPLSRFLHGGGQEFGLRPGTENTPMIAGLGEACEIVRKNLNEFQNHMKQTCNHLQSKLKEEFGKDVTFNFDSCDKLPNTLSASFANISGKELLAECPSVVASTGSACHSSLGTLSRVLLQVLNEETARGTVRLSVGRTTSINDIDSAVRLLKAAYLKLISILM